MVDWSGYLESICKDYAQWWEVYTLTEVVEKQQQQKLEEIPLLLDFELIVQTAEERDKDEEEKEKERIERLGVLEGLRKYATQHVLLLGRPGSGKSTALARFLLEEAQRWREGNEVVGGAEEEEVERLLSGIEKEIRKIPVLVELRYYHTSILDLIQDFLQRHKPNLEVDDSILKNWLRQGQLMLLVDGLNELPSQAARQDLYSFRQNYQKTTPMIFTTRDLGVSGDLDIIKKLEMQSLSERQMQQFVCKYLPKQGEQMLRQLGSRLREFGQTPLLLMMLCLVFAQNRNRVPANLGSVFRQFTQIYSRKLKQDIPISQESRRWWQPMLEQLAWVMTCGEEKTQLQVAIPKQQAETVLIEFLAGKVAHPENCALGWLDDLLNHHLIQLRAGEQIEFRHQLLQEYYTAEYLLKLLTSSHSSPSRISDEELKREYLNYLKWTEPLALMLELVENEAQAVGVVKLALEVDWRLGARLAGAVKEKFQEKTVSLITRLELPQELKIILLGITLSEHVIPSLLAALNNKNYNYCAWHVAESLGKIGSEAAISALLPIALNCKYSGNATYSLGRIGSEAAVSALLEALNNEYSDVRSNAASALGEIASDTAMPALLKVLENEYEDSRVRREAASALGKIGNEAAIPALLEALKDEGWWVSNSAAYALGEIGSQLAVTALLQALKDKVLWIRKKATYVLELISDKELISAQLNALEGDNETFLDAATWALRKIDNKITTPTLLKTLENEDHLIRANAAYALGKIANKAAVPGLQKALKDTDDFVRVRSASALGAIGNKVAVPALVKALKDDISLVRANAASALGKVSNGEVIPELLAVLKDEDDLVRANAAYSLGQIGNKATVARLLTTLTDPSPSVRSCTLFALCQIDPQIAIEKLLLALSDDENCWVRADAAWKLANIGTDAAVVGLLQALKDQASCVRRWAIEGLQQIGTEKAVGELLLALNDKDSYVRKDATYALRKIAGPEILPYLTKLILRTGESQLLDTIGGIQNRCGYYNYNLANPLAQPKLVRTMYILHLSDLHITNLDQANLWSNQLAEDLRNELDIPQLDALIISGDIANYSTPEEYQAAEQFLHNLRQDFPLEPEQIIIVPGNHDLNWKQAKKAYKLIDLEEYEGELQEGYYIQESATVVRVRDEASYKQRFINFSQFYQAIANQTYPQEYDQQGILYHLPQQNLLFLGLNSAWQLDHHYRSRASINMNALSKALTEIRRNRNYDNCLKIAVWHHPLISAYEDRITDSAFLDQLAVAGFRFFLHGHIHEAETSNYRYDMSKDGRNLDQICAGTFGAPTQELVTGTPWQYNLLQFEPDKLTVRTRRRTKENGAWEADSIWRQGRGTSSLDYYTIRF